VQTTRARTQVSGAKRRFKQRTHPRRCVCVCATLGADTRDTTHTELWVQAGVSSDSAPLRGVKGNVRVTHHTRAVPTAGEAGCVH
jgi:hypothetical protein